MFLPLLQHNSKIHTVQKLLPLYTWHCPCYQSPLSFTGFMAIADVQSIFYFIWYKADQYPTSRKIQRPPLPGLVIYDVINGLVFPPGRCLSHRQCCKGTPATVLAPSRAIYIPFLPKLYQQLMQGTNAKIHTPSTE